LQKSRTFNFLLTVLLPGTNPIIKQSPALNNCFSDFIFNFSLRTKNSTQTFLALYNANLFTVKYRLTISYDFTVSCF
jgi:hypothetical protein